MLTIRLKLRLQLMPLKANLKIEELSLQINNKEDTISVDTDAIKTEIKQTNELELNSMLEVILSENNFTNSFPRSVP